MAVHLRVQAAISSVHAWQSSTQEKMHCPKTERLIFWSPLGFTVFGALACRVLCGSELTSFITSLTSQGLSLKKCL